MEFFWDSALTEASTTVQGLRSIGVHVGLNTFKMKLYTRKDFLKLPERTIYSRVDSGSGDLCHGLFCKTSGPEYGKDWVEQDLISEAGFPNGITDGFDAIQYQLNLRDSFQDFQTDLDCAGRDGMFEDSDVFVVWDKSDISKLIQYLSDCI